MKLVIASNNKGKIREYKQLLEKHGYEVMSQSEAGLKLEVEETGTTFAENSALKARAAHAELGCAVLADDSTSHPFFISSSKASSHSPMEICEVFVTASSRIRL